jgi:fumarate hydratase class II
VAGNSLGADQRRIGHALLESEQLWIEQCARRNRALWAAAQALAENAYLAVALAKQAAAIGNRELAACLEEEARAKEHRTV